MTNKSSHNNNDDHNNYDYTKKLMITTTDEEKALISSVLERFRNKNKVIGCKDYKPQEDKGTKPIRYEDYKSNMGDPSLKDGVGIGYYDDKENNKNGL